MFEYKNYQLINLRTIYQLRQDISFKQLRFYCHKKRVGRTLHIMTRLNAKGEMVVRYFSNSTDRPIACGSFVNLPDDTSIVSQHCNSWSVHGDGNWGSKRYNGNWRIQNEPIYVDVGSKHTMQIVPKSSRSYCDDHWDDNVQHSAGDSWFIFVRWFWSIFPKFINFMHRTLLPVRLLSYVHEYSPVVHLADRPDYRTSLKVKTERRPTWRVDSRIV